MKQESRLRTETSSEEKPFFQKPGRAFGKGTFLRKFLSFAQNDFWFRLLASFFIVAFGQPALVPGLGAIASVCGFALFWQALERVERKFWLSVGWFAAVQGVQLSWMASTHYMGMLILVVYGGLSFVLGLQFGLASLFRQRAWAVAGVWVLLEWSRLFWFTGFSFNPVGLALTDGVGIQWAAVGGIYGLSFWVMWVNGLVLQKKWKLALGLAAVPYLFGWIHPQMIEKWASPSHDCNVALLQTALLPEERYFTRLAPERYIEPAQQWKRVWDLLSVSEKLDLIVLPESAFPSSREVSNALLAQMLADSLDAHVILGLDDEDADGKYNSAFHFQPGKKRERYEKQILVPVSEYLPLSNLDFLSFFYAKQYGIFDSCTPGKGGKIFAAFLPIGPSICYEETFTEPMRQLRRLGAELFVNVTNDVWYPGTSLPLQHFHHARVRAAENGVYLLRSCNSGVTGGADRFGKPLPSLPISTTQPGVLLLSVSLQSHPTLYTLWGDGLVLICSLSCALAAFFLRCVARRVLGSSNQVAVGDEVNESPVVNHQEFYP